MKPPKPQRFFKSLVTITFLIFLSTCKKDVNTASQRVLDPDIASARSWYQSSFSTNSSSGSTSGNKSTNSTSHPIYNLNKLIKTDWSRAVKYSRFNKNVIELPADSGGKFSFDLKNATSNQIYSDKKYSRTSLLILSQGRSYEAYIMMVLADPSYIKNDPSKINNNTYRKHDADFTGTVMYFTPNGNYVSGYAYNKGQIVSIASSMLNSQQTQSANKLKINEVDVETCTDWYYDTYVNDQLVSSEYLYTTCVSGSSSGGSGGGASPTPPPCADTTSTEAATSAGHLIINVAQPTPQPIGDPGSGSGDGGFPDPDTGCPVESPTTTTVKDPCSEKITVSNTAANSMIISQNTQIANLSTTIEYGTNQSLTSPTSNTYVNTQITPGTATSWNAPFTWDSTNGYAVGSSHDHPANNGPSPDDVFKMIENLTNTNNQGTQNLLAGGPSAISAYRSKASATVITKNGTFVVTVNDWGKLQTLYTKFLNSPIVDPSTNMNQFDADFQDLASTYASTNQLSNTAGSVYALLSTFEYSINVYEAPPNSTTYQPLIIADTNAVIVKPCP